MEKKQIGVLAVQGAFAEHIAMVRKLGAEAFGDPAASGSGATDGRTDSAGRREHRNAQAPG